MRVSAPSTSYQPITPAYYGDACDIQPGARARVDWCHVYTVLAPPGRSKQRMTAMISKPCLFAPARADAYII